MNGFYTYNALQKVEVAKFGIKRVVEVSEDLRVPLDKF